MDSSFSKSSKIDWLCQIQLQNMLHTYTERHTKKRIRLGGSIANMVYPAVYVASNELGSPRQIAEIVKLSQINRKQFFRGYKRLVAGLQINSSLHNPILILQRLGSNLGLTEKTKRKIVWLLSETKKKSEFCGYNRATLVAAAVYMITNEDSNRLSQKKKWLRHLK